MNPNLKSLLKLMSDGDFHSGAQLGAALGITRAGIWKLIRQLKQYDISIEAKTNVGYKISAGLELLDKKIIAKYAPKIAAKNIVVCDAITSTSTHLVNLLPTQNNAPTVCFAESQTAGRGRLGRLWVSPYGHNIYMSLLWRFAKKPQDLSGLSLVAALAIVRALKEYGITNNISIKWPNDILWNHKKLAGILVELSGETHHVYNAIIGIGINLVMPLKLAPKIKQPYCDIAKIIQARPERNKLSGLVLNNLITILESFQLSGLSPLLPEWQSLDATYEKPVIVYTPQNQEIIGFGNGINSAGEFLLRDLDNNVQAFTSGEVSLRLRNR